MFIHVGTVQLYLYSKACINKKASVYWEFGRDEKHLEFLYPALTATVKVICWSKWLKVFHNWLTTLSLSLHQLFFILHTYIYIQLLKPCSLFSAEPEGIQLGVRRHEYESLWSTLLSIRDSSAGV